MKGREIVDPSELLSMEPNKSLSNRIRHHKCHSFDWQLDVRNQAFSSGEI